MDHGPSPFPFRADTSRLNMTMTETCRHPITDKTLTRQTRRQTVAFGSLRAKVDVPGWYPDHDSDSLHSGADLAAKDEAWRNLRRACGQRVRSIREKLGLTQVEAGRVLGGGPRAFQKCERDAVAPGEAAVGLLEILAADPEKLNILRDLRRSPGP